MRDFRSPSWPHPQTFVANRASVAKSSAKQGTGAAGQRLPAAHSQLQGVAARPGRAPERFSGRWDWTAVLYFFQALLQFKRCLFKRFWPGRRSGGYPQTADSVGLSADSSCARFSAPGGATPNDRRSIQRAGENRRRGGRARMRGGSGNRHRQNAGLFAGGAGPGQGKRAETSHRHGHDRLAGTIGQQGYSAAAAGHGFALRFRLGQRPGPLPVPAETGKIVARGS